MTPGTGLNTHGALGREEPAGAEQGLGSSVAVSAGPAGPHRGGVLIQLGGKLCSFGNPTEIVSATCPGEVLPALERVAQAGALGLHAAGFLTYEAASAFDPALVTHAPGPLPLLWFGLYAQPETIEFLPQPEADTQPLQWSPASSREEYLRGVARIRELIAAGDTYQVNYTHRLRAQFHGDPWQLFLRLHHAQRAQYSAYIDLGEHVLCSASPELFFRLRGEEIEARPMKGTAPRGLSAADDRARADQLARSSKDRAENLMIVDMLRNDLGRVAEWGSVRVPSLFALERYPTLWQMTSTVTAKTRASITEILRALFPCASITGAPKVRTMQIISQLESQPRGIYTGCIGYVGPGRQAQFNVAIRTVHIDKRNSLAEYGTGGGIVWDSTADDEYAESLTKARVLTALPQPRFDLLETILWRPRSGYFLLDAHLGRVAASAEYFAFSFDAAAVRAALVEATASFERVPQRVRLLVAADGRARVEASALTGVPRPVRVALAKDAVHTTDLALYHKTTWREIYQRARIACPHADDVILWNERGEITESTIANVVAQLDGRLVTPPVCSGLLPGIFRAHLLATGRVAEGVVSIDELQRAEAIYLVNSVRGVVRARLITDPRIDEASA